MPNVDPNSQQMIAVAPGLGIHLDACIATPFAVHKGDVAEQQPSKVVMTKPNKAPFKTCPEMGDDDHTWVAMPPTLAGYVIDNFGDSRMVVDYYAYGAKEPWKSFEMFQPKQTGANTFSYSTGAWHYRGVNYTQTMFTPGGGSGGGLSLSQYLLRESDLNSDLHPLLCTLPPRMFGLVDPSKSVNDAYCSGLATLPLGASVAENGTKGNAAWGTGVTVFLKHIPLPAGLSSDAVWFINALINKGVMVCDRDSASRKPEVMGIVGEQTPRVIALAKEIQAKLGSITLSAFTVAPMTRYNYHTKVYPV